jgi:hypothetical protein
MRTLFIIPLCALSVGNATAQNTTPAAADTVPELEILREEYDKARARIHEDALARLNRLNQQHLQSLDNLIGQLTRQGKLDQALAVRAEKNRLLSVAHAADNTASRDESEPDVSQLERPSLVSRPQLGNSDYIYLCDLPVVSVQAEHFVKGDPEKWEVNKRIVRKGLLAWAPSEIVYDLTRMNVVFLEGAVGIAPANVNSTTRFEICGDEKVLWQSGVMTQDPKRPGTSLTENFKIDVSGVKNTQAQSGPPWFHQFRPRDLDRSET